MLAAKNLVKRFSSDDTETTVLNDVSLTVEQGRFVSIVGRSGSGKTTLMNVMSTLLAPDGGAVEYQGRNLARIKERDLNVLRRLDFAVIFQFHYLLPYLTALENTLLPFMASAAPVSKALKDKARDSLARVGLSTKADRLPGQLSGGEQQRVAIARALVKRARVLFADEPTGSLDKKTGASVMGLIRGLNQEEGLTVVMVTHDPGYAEYGDQVVEIEDGRILGIRPGAGAL
jgi:putative ABC transport system ATP-binding protein